MHFVASYLPLLLATVLVEGCIAWWWAPPSLRRRGVEAAISLNLLTHASATLAMLHLQVPFGALELAIVAVELLGFYWLVGLRLRSALGLALVANLATIALAFAWSAIA
jgi:hypothetical protein